MSYLMSVCLLSSQLKGDFKWLESSLTKTERTALSHLIVNVIYKFLKQKDFFWNKERNIKEDVTYFFPALMFLFQKRLGILNSNQKINGGRVCVCVCPGFEHLQVSFHAALRIQGVSHSDSVRKYNGLKS